MTSDTKWCMFVVFLVINPSLDNAPMSQSTYDSKGLFHNQASKSSFSYLARSKCNKFELWPAANSTLSSEWPSWRFSVVGAFIKETKPFIRSPNIIYL